MSRDTKRNMDHRYAMKVELDEEGDFFMRLPEALVEDLGWIEGTLLDFEEDIDGSVILNKVKD